MILTIPFAAPAAATAVAAPWWGVPVVAGTFLIVGAVLGFFFNRANENRKTAREDQLRWHDQVRQLSAEATAVARHVGELCMQKDTLENPRDPTDEHYRKVDDEFRDAYVKMMAISASLGLIAPRSITVAIEAMTTNVFILYANDLVYDDQRKEFTKSLDEFIETNRKYLGALDDIEQ